MQYSHVMTICVRNFTNFENKFDGSQESIKRWQFHKKSWQIINPRVLRRLRNLVFFKKIFFFWLRLHLSHRFSLPIKSLINFKDMVDFEVSQRLGLWFYRSISLTLFCSPLHVNFRLIEHMILALIFKK